MNNNTVKEWEELQKIHPAHAGKHTKIVGFYSDSVQPLDLSQIDKDCAFRMRNSIDPASTHPGACVDWSHVIPGRFEEYWSRFAICRWITNKWRVLKLNVFAPR